MNVYSKYISIPEHTNIHDKVNSGDNKHAGLSTDLTHTEEIFKKVIYTK